MPSCSMRCVDYLKEHMFHALRRLFIRSAVVVLLLTGAAKISSAFGGARILQTVDPVLGLHFSYVMIIAGALELLVAFVCVFERMRTLSLSLLAWLATIILAYRLGLWWTGWHRPCSCLGNLTDILHIQPQIADNIMKGVLAYLFIGSYGILSYQWWTRMAERRMKK